MRVRVCVWANVCVLGGVWGCMYIKIGVCTYRHTLTVHGASLLLAQQPCIIQAIAERNLQHFRAAGKGICVLESQKQIWTLLYTFSFFQLISRVKYFLVREVEELSSG